MIPFRRRLFLYLSWVLITGLTAGCSQVSANPEQSSAPAIQLQDCQLSAPGSALRVEARCGTLDVFENREASSGRKISLNIAVIPAVSRNPAPDAFFFLAGGPGEAATEAYISISLAFNRLNQKRDIVLVDQRGTGKSNPLDCDLETEAESQGEDATQAIVQACLKSWQADPRFYTTSIAMDDLDQVREALGYPQVNLYGASYGTRAALVYLRQHPGRVRSLILDGVVPLNWILGPGAAGDAQTALDAIFARCRADADCNAAFPLLPQEFQSLLDKLQAEPVEVSMEHPLTGEPLTYTLTREVFASSVHLLSYSAETTALLPLLIHSTYAEEDFRRFAALTVSSFSSVEQSISYGMRFSVLCAEDIPNYTEGSGSTGYLEDFIPTSFKEICEFWPAGQAPAGFSDPVRSDVPVLLISGENDPVTPPANAELAGQTLSNSRHWIVPGMGHINIYRGCIPNLVTEFIEAGSLDELDAACIQQILPMPFLVNFNGPIP